MNILVSACLLGVECRYNGGGCLNDGVMGLSAEHLLLPVCPEQLGGLPTPREPSERLGDKVVSSTGRDVTAQFERGAQETVKIAEMFHCSCAVMKSKSPSCGCGMIYDGSFSGSLIPGNGTAAQKLLESGIHVYSEDRIDELKMR